LLDRPTVEVSSMLRMPRRLLPVIALAAVAAGCQSPSGGGTFDGDRFYPAEEDVFEAQQAATVGDGPNGAHIIFLNFDGATIKRATNGNDNAATNTSWIPKTSQVTVSPFNEAPYAPTYTRQAAIDTIVSSVRSFYSRFNVHVTTTRPASGRYLMVMVGGSAGDVMSSPGSAVGVAPVDCGNRIESNVAFAFSDDLEPWGAQASARLSALKNIAVTAAHEAGHSFGLEHTTNQADIMYPATNPNVTGFGGPANLAAGSSAQCTGGSATQDSSGMLMQVLGPSSGQPVGPLPDVAFLSPPNMGTVPLTFTVAVSAGVTGGTISRVEISSGGNVITTLTTPPYREELTAPQAGSYELTATAFTAAGDSQTATVQFRAQSGATAPPIGCQRDSDCDMGTTCQGGQCKAGSPGGGGNGGGGGGHTCDPVCADGEVCQADATCAPGSSEPRPGELGAACSFHDDCNSRLCAMSGSGGYCTQACDPMAGDTCPSTMECQSISGGDHICVPRRAAQGGCSVAGGGGDPALVLLTLGLGLFAATARRRRRRASSG
jgi:MYXO-CTERM domain-containing protein